jgi:uncharacterized protein
MVFQRGGAIVNLLKRHPFWIFYFWCYLIPSVLVLSLLRLPAPFYWAHGGPFQLDTLLRTTAAQSGVHLRGGALIPLLRSYGSQGVLVFIILCSAIPAVVALILTPLTFGRQGLVTLLSRLRPWQRGVALNQGLRVWGVAILILIATNLFSYLLLRLLGTRTGETVVWNDKLLSAAFFWLVLEAMFTNQGGLLEELGWRGYGLPLLLGRMNPLRATVLLGILWAIWHIPRDVLFHFISGLGTTRYLFVYLPLFISWCVGSSILMTYFFNQTGGSALICVAIHGMLNDSAGISGKVLGGDMIHSMLPRAIAVLTVGILTAVLAGPKLGLKPDS